MLEVHIRVEYVGYLELVKAMVVWVSVNGIIFVVYTINVQLNSFHLGLCNRMGWGYRFFINECVRRELCNDMCIWERPK